MSKKDILFYLYIEERAHDVNFDFANLFDIYLYLIVKMGGLCMSC
jgi:hypothetical protein